jgi:GGDEF domain-containing protein
MTQEHEVLPGELTTFRAVGLLGFVLGALGGVSLWLTEPSAIHSTPIAWITTLACAFMAVVMATVPWQRVHPAWLLTPASVAAAVIAAAIQNMDGGREVYDGFFLYLALSAGYFLPARYVRIIVGIIAVASAVPLLLDSSSESIVRWAYVAAGNGVVAVVVRASRVRVRAYAAEVRKLALQDQLTGVLNRRGFEERAGAEIARARRSERDLALIYLDLDGFKRVNDNLSHAAGDRVLRRAALAMAGVLRGEDVLARMGGDEFVVLLDGACRGGRGAPRGGRRGGRRGRAGRRARQRHDRLVGVPRRRRDAGRAAQRRRCADARAQARPARRPLSSHRKFRR